MLHLLYHQGPLGTICLQQDSDYVCLWPVYHLYHDIAKHGYSGVVKESTGEWNGTLLSSVMRISSVCMRVMNIQSMRNNLRQNFQERQKMCLSSLSIMMMMALVLPLLHFCERDSGGLFHCGVTTNFIYILILYYPCLHGRFAR